MTTRYTLPTASEGGEALSYMNIQVLNNNLQSALHEKAVSIGNDSSERFVLLLHALRHDSLIPEHHEMVAQGDPMNKQPCTSVCTISEHLTMDPPSTAGNISSLL